MRIKFEEKKFVYRGTQRIRKAFLWLPIKIGEELRWLEKAEWLQEANEGYDADWYDDGRLIKVRWDNKKWID